MGAYFEYTHGFADFLLRTPSLAFDRLCPEPTTVHEFHMDVALISTVVALVGVGLAAFLVSGRPAAGRLAGQRCCVRCTSFRTASSSSIRFTTSCSSGRCGLLAKFSLSGRPLGDRWAGEPGRQDSAGLSALCVRLLQTGMVQFYALAMVLGVIGAVGRHLLADGELAASLNGVDRPV